MRFPSLNWRIKTRRSYTNYRMNSFLSITKLFNKDKIMKAITNFLKRVKSAKRSEKIAYAWCYFMFYELNSYGKDARKILYREYSRILSDNNKMKLVHSLEDLLRKVGTFDQLQRSQMLISSSGLLKPMYRYYRQLLNPPPASVQGTL